MVKCKAIDVKLGNKYGNKCFFMDEAQAESLQSKGRLKIVEGKEPDVQKAEPDNVLKRGSWQSGRRTRVAWVMDMEKKGGAELSSLFCIDIGEKCGFDIIVITPQNFRPNIIKTADIIILNNMHHFSESQINQIEYILKEECCPFITYSHDYRGLKYIKQRRWLYELSKFNVFISPAHSKKYNVNNNIILPLAINTEDFYVDNSVERVENSLLIPVPAKHENITKAVRDYRDKKIYVTGSGFPDATKLPRVNNDGMRKYYNMVSTVYHCPEIAGAGDRVIFEAKLCGCDVICNEKPGHASWPEKKDLKGWLDKAPYDLWKEVAKYV